MTADPALVAGLAAGAACWLATRPPVRRPLRPHDSDRSASEAPTRRTPRWAAAAAFVGAWAFVGGPLGFGAGVVVATVVWHVVARSESPAAARERRAVERELPALVLLFAAALRGGAPTSRALAVACEALPGCAAERLVGARARLELGLPAEDVWRGLGEDPVLAPLGHMLASAVRSGAPVAAAAQRLAEDLARDARGRAENRARTVGVRAAVPLGLCLLPAFLLIGIVPVVAGLLSTLLP